MTCADKQILVFVFGTLKQGFPNHHVNAGVRVSSDFKTQSCYPLYLVGDRFTPWLVDNPGQGYQVCGEVYSISRSGLLEMDRLERVNQADGYVRNTILVIDPKSVAQQVQVYLKPAQQLIGADIKGGPLDCYTLADAGHYRQRSEREEQ